MNSHYIFTETAFIHQGDANYLYQLIDKVAQSPANGIKFQVLTQASDFLSSFHKGFEELSSYCFSKEKWREIIAYAVQKELDVVMMPLNIDALDLCADFPIKWLEIHSVSQNDWFLKHAVKETGIDLIITSGGRYEEEIELDIQFFDDQVSVLMVGFQAFPSRLEDVRLGQISYWKRKYPDIQIGYADHSAYNHENAIKSLEYAYFLGATVFEKHVALEPGEERVDYSAAVSIEVLAEIEKRLEFLAKNVLTKGDTQEDMTDTELGYRKRQLICVAARDLDAGTVLTANDIKLKMYHDVSKTFDSAVMVEGQKLSQSIKGDMPFLKNHF